MEHHDGEQGEEQVQQVRERHQQPDVHKVKAHEGGVAADTVDTALHQLRAVFLGYARPPVVRHCAHSDDEERHACCRQSHAYPLHCRAVPQGREQCPMRIDGDAQHLDRHDEQGGDAHCPLDEQGALGLVADANLVGGNALSPLQHFLAEVRRIEDCQQGYGYDFGEHHSYHGLSVRYVGN